MKKGRAVSHVVLTAVVKVSLNVLWLLMMHYSVAMIRVLTLANTWKSSTCAYQVRKTIIDGDIQSVSQLIIHNHNIMPIQ